MSRTHEDLGNDKDQAIADALQEAEERHKEELAAAVNELKNQLEKDKEQALLNQKQVKNPQYVPVVSKLYSGIFLISFKFCHDLK